MNLVRLHFIKAVLQSRYPQFIIMIVLLIGYLFAILAGLIGTQVGSHNFSTIVVWVGWWAALIMLITPLGGRAWCAVCPIPLVGEWFQRGAILLPSNNSPRWPGLRWPKFLRNIWLQNLAFLSLALFSSVLLTTPRATAIVLVSMLFLALGISLIFERRAFCRYLCPIGGFIGLYAQAAPVALRVTNKQICANCADKPCYNGSSAGYGCPWGVYPGGLTRNTYCGLCLECLRTCPHQNIAVHLRPFGVDLAKPSMRLDEACKVFLMSGSAMVYAGVLLGPWGSLKSAAYHVGTSDWFMYAGTFLTISFVVLPGIFVLGFLRWKDRVPLKRIFLAFSTALIPLGLTFWIAFSLSFIFVNASYLPVVFSDPLGWGWNLFGTAHIPWRPVFTAGIVPVQILALVGGLVWSTRIASQIARSLGISHRPAIVYAFLLTVLMLWLLV